VLSKNWTGSEDLNRERQNTFERAGDAVLWRGVQHGGVQLIFLLRLVILAWILSPDDFGLLAIATILIDVLMRLTNLGMIPALIQRRGLTDAHYDAAWSVDLLRALLIFAATFVAAPFVAQFMNEPRATDLIRMLAVRPLITAGASIKVAEMTRALNFRSLTLMELSKAAANALTAIMLAPFLGVWSLVAGTLAGPAVYLVLSYWIAPHRPRLSIDKTAVQSLIRFGRWIFATSLVTLFGQTILRIVVARELGSIELGLYYLAVSIAFLPGNIADHVVGEVSFPLYSKLQTEVGALKEAFQSILTTLTTLLVPVYALLLVLAPSLVENVLGGKWVGTAPIIQVLVVANLIGLLGDTIIPIFKGVGRPHLEMLANLVLSGTLAALIWMFVKWYGVLGAAMAWIPAVLASQIVALIFMRGIISQPFSGMTQRLITVATVSVVTSVIVQQISSIVQGLPGLIVGGLIGGSISLTSLWLIERHFRIGLAEGLVRAFPKLANVLGVAH